MAADAAVVAVARARVAAGDSRVAGDRARVADIFRVAEDEASRAAGANISQDQAVAVPVASRVVVARTDFLTALGDSLEAKTSRDVEVFWAGNRGFNGGQRFSGGDRGRAFERGRGSYYRGGYYRGGRFYGGGYYGGYYPSYGFGYYGGTYCNPYGYYDAWGNWIPGCGVDPYYYDGGYYGY